MGTFFELVPIFGARYVVTVQADPKYGFRYYLTPEPALDELFHIGLMRGDWCESAQESWEDWMEVRERLIDEEPAE